MVRPTVSWVGGSFTAREDDGTGLYYYRARYYHPVLARFVSEDPLDLVDGSNSYLYTLDEPIDWVDPSGLMSLGGQLFIGIGLSLDIGYARGVGFFLRERFGYGFGAGVGVDLFDNGITPRDCPPRPGGIYSETVQQDWEGRFWEGGFDIGPVSLGFGRSAGSVKYNESYQNPYGNDFLHHQVGESTYSQTSPFLRIGKGWKYRIGFSKGVEYGSGDANYRNCGCK